LLDVAEHFGASHTARNRARHVRGSASLSIGFFLFVPDGYDKFVLMQCGLRVLVSEDVIRNITEIAERRKAARASRSAA